MMKRAGLTVCIALLLMAGGAAAARANGWEHGAVPFEALVLALQDDAPAIRQRAAESLGYRGQPEAVPPLLALVAGPEANLPVRRAAYVALGRIGDRRGLEVLTACLTYEPEDALRADCALALGLMAAPPAVPALLASLEDDASFLVKSRVVDALGSFRTAAAVAALSGFLGEGANRSLRQRAIPALARSGAPQAVAPLLDALKESWGGADQIALIDALGRLAAPAAAPILTALLGETEDAVLRIHIIVALGAIRDGSAAPALIDLLAEPDLPTRYFAIRALHDLGDPMAAGPIGALASKLAEDVTAQDGDALLADGRRTLARLSLLEAALRALTDLDPGAGLAPMLAMAGPVDLPRDSAMALKLADGVYQIRRRALFGLGYTGAADAHAALSGPAGLGDPDPRLRAVALRALGVLGRNGTTALLLPHLDDDAAEARWTAASVLGRLDDKAAVPALIARLGDPVAEVRKQAALALGYLGDAQALAPLQALATDDPAASVREAAAYAADLLSDAQ